MSHQESINLYRIAIADDHSMFREAIAAMINNWNNCRVIIEAANCNELIDGLANDPSVDLVLLDTSLPCTDNHQLVKQLRGIAEGVKILLLSTHYTPLAASRMNLSGANGFIYKTAGMPVLKTAICNVMETGHYLPGNIQVKDETYSYLSDHELSFVRYSCTDMTYKEIAGRLKINERQVDYIREILFTRFKVQSRVGLAMYAIRSGLADGTIETG